MRLSAANKRKSLAVRWSPAKNFQLYVTKCFSNCRAKTIWSSTHCQTCPSSSLNLLSQFLPAKSARVSETHQFAQTLWKPLGAYPCSWARAFKIAIVQFKIWPCSSIQTGTWPDGIVALSVGHSLNQTCCSSQWTFACASRQRIDSARPQTSKQISLPIVDCFKDIYNNCGQI